MKVKVILKQEFPKLDFIGSRNAGEVIREKMDNIITNKQVVILDFDGILSITQSFADEIVGIYVRAFGVKYIKENIEVINANDDIKVLLNFVVKYSKKHHKAA